MKLSDLFDIEICKNPISRDYALENPGKTPYVTTTSENNGIECYVDYPPQYSEGVLTVSKDGGNGDAFLQNIPFCGNEKVMVLTPKQKLSQLQLFYYVSVIKFNKIIFGYGRKCSVGRLGELYIPAPDEIPTFVNSYDIKPITTSNKAKAFDLNVSQWKEFQLDKLFDIKKGKRLTAEDQEEGPYNYIGAIDKNNGVANHIGQAPIHQGNTISLSYNGSVGEAFYQKEPYWATDDVNSLYSYYERFNEKIALFIITVLKQEKYKFSYGRKWTLENMKATKINLPIQYNQDGSEYFDASYKYSEKGYVPDWTFMENYIKSLPYGDRI